MLNTTVTLTSDSPAGVEPVTFGLPLGAGMIESAGQIRVSKEGVEIWANVKPGLLWHGTDFLRSVTINVQVDMSGGDVILTITDEGRTLTGNLIEAEWVSAGPDKADLTYPRVLALHDIEYLAQSGIVSPFGTVSQEFIDYLDTQFLWSGPLVYSEMIRANWLFDRPSAYFKAYMVTGDARYLKEAILSTKHYFNHIETAGTPKPAGGRGGFFMDGIGKSDGKYIYTQAAKLYQALVGESTQWDDSLINDMAIQADLGWHQHPTDDPHDFENEGFTERAAGIAGLAELNAYEITGDLGILANMDRRISSLKGMQQDTLEWKTEHGWPLSGAFDHNVMVHEGAHSQGDAPIGSTNDHGFSPWMSEQIADFLWQAYWVTGNQDAPEMLRLLGNAVNEYGYTTSYDPLIQIFVTKGFVDAQGKALHTRGENTRRADTDMLYLASAQADMETLQSDKYWPWYSDVHGIETVLTLGAAYYFETDRELRAGLKARIEAILDGSLNAAYAAIDDTPRLYNWQHRSMSVGIWEWILSSELFDPEPEPEPEPEPNDSINRIASIAVLGNDDPYWAVRVDGIDLPEKHLTQMKAWEQAINELLPDPEQKVLIVHYNAIYSVTAVLE